MINALAGLGSTHDGVRAKKHAEVLRNERVGKARRLDQAAYRLLPATEHIQNLAPVRLGQRLKYV